MVLPSSIQQGAAKSQIMLSQQKNGGAIPDSTTTTSSSSYLLEQKAQEGIKRAQAILARQQQQQLEAKVDKNDTDYALQRQRHAQREAKRLRLAMIKNLEYVAQKDEAMIQSQITNMQVLKQQQQQQSKKRERQELKKSLLSFPKQHQAAPGLYVSGLTNSKNTNNNDDDDDKEKEEALQGMLKILFCSYGKIKQVKLYRHKESQKLKGDGLVLFHHKMELDLQTICAQVSAPHPMFVHMDHGNYKGEG
eukprot:CAMPEP_0118712364 /NCGR_PEP_ID=MMETSP0800-20121206/24753_1 /TAXON_ID=210618 ORGANISM="Striatella unipunctata, Strain CCMP2910" /NCGR_SAMPLE_ID=MMETSP0800 /ASSEMBLY_ACC=CAM_ASM_000638 /LENGTH=248 /DNA_ID=CAMNT_0006617363 /DNA_START=171 /DNA_END=917 /DNA_ORIENTATION=-